MNKVIPAVYLLLSILSTSVLFSQSSPENLIGGWKLIRKTGGMTGHMSSKVDHDFIAFSSDCKFYGFLKGSLKFSSDYSLRKAKSIYTDSLYRIEVDNKYIDDRSFTASKNQLIIRDEYYDGFTAVYTRKLNKNEVDKFAAIKSQKTKS